MPEDDQRTLSDATLTPAEVGPERRPSAHSLGGDRYELGEQIGRGGMGEVRLARDIRIDRDVAVKLMRPDLRNDEASTMRFFREARVQGRLDHPAIPPVYDLGVDERGNPYFVMKRLTGTTLFDVLGGRNAAKWPRRQLLAKLVDVCLAVEFAHTRGVVHRDLKPSNIMLGDFGEVYVLDWGLARVLDASGAADPLAPISVDRKPHETAVGDLLGTPGYMAPEQLRDSSVDGRADVYALGCILYEIVTGHSAMPHGLAAVEHALSARCMRPTDRFPDVPLELDDLCARASDADPAERPTAREVAGAIQGYLDGDRDLARRRELAAAHATNATDAADRPGDDARANAISEAGRALVLDPENKDAQAVLARLMLDVPRELPHGARVELERDRGEMRREVMQSLGHGYSAVTLLFLSAFFMDVNHPLVLGAAICTCAFTGVFAVLVSRAGVPELGSARIAMLIGLNSATLWLSSIVFGPLFLMPVFVICSIAVALTQPMGYRWPVLAATQLLGIVGPLACEWLGFLPSTYHVGPEGLVLSPWVVTLTPRFTLAAVLLTLVSQIAVTAIVQTARVRAQTKTEDRLYAIRWHLEQLLPNRKRD
ncbi:MAG TPA: serine/threonine-protein kinase [Kofleriaceae bacterium]|jgi:serine/threonine-protein kinase